MSQMALLPYVVNTFQALNIYDQLTEPMIVPEEQESPWQFNEDAFNVNLDVQHFKPNELNVKILNNFIYVEGKHEEDEDEHGYIARHFIRRYELPSDVDLKYIECNYSTDGILTIHVPKKVITLICIFYTIKYF
jgi:HSP20 family molecular chaperone IbpA